MPEKLALSMTFELTAGSYISYPPKEKANGHILLYYPDVFGFFTNGLLVCDSFAEAGYLTIGIDYFKGVSGSTLLETG